MISIRACLSATMMLAASLNVQAGQARVAIIIDDLGYRLDVGQRAISLPGPVSFAVLPGAPRAAALARRAHESGKEVLLHLPLQANVDDNLDEPIRIDLDMSREQLATSFEAALSSVPHVVGVNGHRGSLLTRHPGHMQWLMEEIRAREDLFFVDSYTTVHSVALQMATEAGVSALRRDVFLDPDPKPAAVKRQFERMKTLAKKRGFVVAIGHPYDATLALLEKELPKLGAEGIELVTISELVRNGGQAPRSAEIRTVSAGEFVEPRPTNGL